MNNPFEIDDALFTEEKAPRKKFTARDEKAVRELRGEMTQKVIASIYNVSISTVQRAQRRAR